MRQRRRPPSCELGQLRPLQQIAQFVAAQAAVLHQAALARGYLSGAHTDNTENISHIQYLWQRPSSYIVTMIFVVVAMCSVNQNPNLNTDAVIHLALANIRAGAG